MLFTTSWDDGHPLDLTLASMLGRYGCMGTFYLSKSGYGGQRLTNADIHLLGEHHEIGAHTLTHPSLPSLSHEEVEREIGGSKEWLEQILQRECVMFAYPFGAYTDPVRDAVEHCGFRGARTTEDLLWREDDPFLLTTSVQVHPFPLKPVWNRHAFSPLRTLWGRLNACHIPLIARRSWLSMAKAAWHYAVETRQPWFHLWGHSWALTQYGLWGHLEAFLRFVAAQENVEYGPNSALLANVR